MLDDKMSIGNAELGGIIYEFYEGRFFVVSLRFDGEDNYDLLEAIRKERYGREELKEGFYQFSWLGQNTSITIYYDIAEEYGFLMLNSTVILSEQFEDEKRREAEKAEGDW